jgi:hypothetical protein
MNHPSASPRTLVSLAAAFLLASTAGCKHAQVNPGTEAAAPAGLAADGLPPTIYVAPFATDAAEVQIDPGGPLTRLREGEPLLQRQHDGLLGGLFNPQGDQQNPYQTSTQVSQEEVAAAATLQKHVADALRHRGVPASVASNYQVGTPNSLLLTGQFLTIDEGSKTKRIAIGLGAGASYLETQAELRDLSQPENLPILSFHTQADSGSAPGALVSGGAGAAVGGAAAVSAGVSGFRQSQTGTPSDIADTSGKIADYILQYYQKQGWLPPTPPAAAPAPATPAGSP